MGSYDACGVCNGPGTSTNVDVSPCPQAIAIATATNWTNAACVEETGLFECGCADIPGDWHCNGNQPDALGVAGATAPRMKMETACATTRTTAWAC